LRISTRKSRSFSSSLFLHGFKEVWGNRNGQLRSFYIPISSSAFVQLSDHCAQVALVDRCLGSDFFCVRVPSIKKMEFCFVALSRQSRARLFRCFASRCAILSSASSSSKAGYLLDLVQHLRFRNHHPIPRSAQRSQQAVSCKVSGVYPPSRTTILSSSFTSRLSWPGSMPECFAIAACVRVPSTADSTSCAWLFPKLPYDPVPELLVALLQKRLGYDL